MNRVDREQNSYDNDSNEHDVVVKKEDFVILSDPNCKHTFRKDEDDIVGYDAWVCTKCHRGTLLPEGYTIK